MFRLLILLPGLFTLLSPSNKFFNYQIYFFCFKIVYFCFFLIFSDFFRSLFMLEIILSYFLFYCRNLFTLFFDYDSLSEKWLADLLLFSSLIFIFISSFRRIPSQAWLWNDCECSCRVLWLLLFLFFYLFVGFWERIGRNGFTLIFCFLTKHPGFECYCPKVILVILENSMF